MASTRQSSLCETSANSRRFFPISGSRSRVCSFISVTKAFDRAPLVMRHYFSTVLRSISSSASSPITLCTDFSAAAASDPSVGSARPALSAA